MFLAPKINSHSGQMVSITSSFMSIQSTLSSASFQYMTSVAISNDRLFVVKQHSHLCGRDYYPTLLVYETSFRTILVMPKMHSHSA